MFGPASAHRPSSSASDRRRARRRPLVRLPALGLLLAAMLVAVSAAPAGAALTSRSRITTAGVGPIRIGMTAAQARRAAGRSIHVFSGEVSPGCQSAQLSPRRYGVSLLLTDGRIRRIYVDRRGIATRSGVRVGDDVARLRRAYGSRLVVVRAPYSRTGRIYELRFGARKLTFLTERGRILDISTGRKPEIDYVEGCA